MELKPHLDWPENAPTELGNPKRIEEFLREQIKSRQISLIGELNLTSPTAYAGVQWSLFELADYLANKNIIKNSLKSEMMENWVYPATLAIWTVGKAQQADDGAIKMWDISEYTNGQLANLASMFTRSIEMLELPTFDGELIGSQKHVQLARIHAMIPDFATQRYSEIIHRAVKYNQSKVQILNLIIDDTIISKGVRRLFSARQDIGLDLIDRSFNFLAYGYELDLPERLKNKLNREGTQRKTKRKVDDFPAVIFQEFAGSIEVRGVESWKIVNEDLELLDPQKIPAQNIYALRDDTGKVKILDTSQGFLLFGINGHLLYGSTLPLGGGYLVWHQSVKIGSEIEHLEEGFLPLWPQWSFTYFQDLSELSLELADHTIKRLEGRKVVSVSDSKVPNMLDMKQNNIYSSYPIIEEPGYLTLTDHLRDEQLELINHSGPVFDGLGGEIDLTISAGLGKSKNFKGVVIPGISVSGLENAMPLGAIAKIAINLPEDWQFTFPEIFKEKSSAFLEFKVGRNQDISVLRVRDYAKVEHFIGLEIPVLSWSVEFTNRESVTVGSTLKIDLPSRKNVRALILHGVNEYVPILKVGEVPIPGRKRGEDARYDLRVLADVLSDAESTISMTWNYETLDLVKFSKPISKKLQTVDVRDLAAAAIAKNIISEEDWKSYQAETFKESADLRMLLRRQRGRN